MARSIQVLLPLACVVLAEAQLSLPFFDITGLGHPARPIIDGPREERQSHNVGYHSGYNSWFQHFGNPDEHKFSSSSHERAHSYEDFDPFYHRDDYYDDDWDHNMPGINNVLNIKNPGHSTHKHLPSHKKNNPEQKPKQDHIDGSNVQKPKNNPKTNPANDKKLTDQTNGPKINEANVSDMKNNSETLPPKTNKIKKEDDKGDGVGVDKKKDFLLVGQGNNGNNVYLLHENNPNLNTVIPPNTNQPGNNIIYVPYNPGQPNNQVYQVVNGQPVSLSPNQQMTANKIGISTGYNTAPLNPGQPTINAGNQNPGYVTIYSNGQLIQIPGVVVNSAPNVPSTNGNQGINYIIANTVPNNVQTVPVQNPGTNVIYATLPNQASNAPLYIQMPNCIQAIPNSCTSGVVIQNPVQGVNNGMSNNGLPSNVAVYQPNSDTVSQTEVYPGSVPNGYVHPNVVTSPASPSPGNAVFNNQNGYQPAVEPSGNQPFISNLGQGQNVPSQGGVSNNQNIPMQPAVQMPVTNGNNGYNQALVTNHKQDGNGPNQGEVMNNQNVPFQPVVQMPGNSGIPGYNQPMTPNQSQGLNAPNQRAMVNNQNMPTQPAVEIPLTNGYNEHPMVTNPNPSVSSRDQMTNNQNAPSQPALSANSDPNQGNAIVNTPLNAAVAIQPGNTQPLAATLVLDSNNLSSLGAQPAIMISGFKDTGDKKNKKNKSKDKKGKKEKKENRESKDNRKKEDNKSKEEADKPKDPKPFTNKKI